MKEDKRKQGSTYSDGRKVKEAIEVEKGRGKKWKKSLSLTA